VFRAAHSSAADAHDLENLRGFFVGHMRARERWVSEIL